MEHSPSLPKCSQPCRKRRSRQLLGLPPPSACSSGRRRVGRQARAEGTALAESPDGQVALAVWWPGAPKMVKHGGVADLVVGVGSGEGLPAEVGQCGKSGGAALCNKERKHASHKIESLFISIQQERSFTSSEETCSGRGGTWWPWMPCGKDWSSSLFSPSDQSGRRLGLPRKKGRKKTHFAQSIGDTLFFVLLYSSQ
jgi:hypothetical protein